MQLEIVTPDKKVFQGEVSEASFPGASGAFQVLNNHAPIVSTLINGKVKIQGNIKLDDFNKLILIQEGNDTFFEIQSGALEMRDNKVILLTD